MPNRLIKFASMLIIFMPVFLITGPFLSDLSVILIDLIFLYLIFKNQNTDVLLRNNLFIFFLYLMFIFQLDQFLLMKYFFH